ncbi:hypothetical protein ACFQES_16020 [Nonomuraea salmonea]|uniref:hypothetical protein n=1 Tax=Nonomuraea salmonea TaxID=46181 RepID=UPI003624031B
MADVLPQQAHFGIAAIALAAVTAAAAPAHADDELTSTFSLLRQLNNPFCLPGATTTGIPVVDSLLPGLVGCPQAPLVR